jgi:hypothetical protein
MFRQNQEQPVRPRQDVEGPVDGVEDNRPMDPSVQHLLETVPPVELDEAGPATNSEAPPGSGAVILMLGVLLTVIAVGGIAFGGLVVIGVGLLVGLPVLLVMMWYLWRRSHAAMDGEREAIAVGDGEE